jgi:ribosomal-protein-alanine N-acetyltransferase
MIDVLRGVNMHRIPSPEMPELDWRHCCVALIEGRVVGLSGYRLLPDGTAKTTLMAVLSEYRGLHLGHALQTWRMRLLRELGIRTLVTNADRPETIEWYKRHFGYRAVGHVPKEHEFGRSDIDSWTTLQVDLQEWEPGL